MNIIRFFINPFRVFSQSDEEFFEPTAVFKMRTKQVPTVLIKQILFLTGFCFLYLQFCLCSSSSRYSRFYPVSIFLEYERKVSCCFGSLFSPSHFAFRLCFRVSIGCAIVSVFTFKLCPVIT